LNFFFQAEDGIRDDLVTGVQTCALPISRLTYRYRELRAAHRSAGTARARSPGAPGKGLLANEAPSRLRGGIRVRGLPEDAGIVADHDVLLGRDVRRQLHKHVGLGRSDRPDEREEVVPAPDEARDGAPVAADANDVAVLAELYHVGEANKPGRQLQRVIYVEGVHLHPAPPAVARVPAFLD